MPWKDDISPLTADSFEQYTWWVLAIILSILPWFVQGNLFLIKQIFTHYLLQYFFNCCEERGATLSLCWELSVIGWFLLAIAVANTIIIILCKISQQHGILSTVSACLLPYDHINCCWWYLNLLQLVEKHNNLSYNIIDSMVCITLGTYYCLKDMREYSATGLEYC